MLLYDSLSLVVINAFRSGLLGGGMVQEKGSQERRSSWNVLHAQRLCTNAVNYWNRISSVMCLVASDICWDCMITHWLSLQDWWRTTPIFYTATDTVTDLVNIERVGNRQQDAMLFFYVGFNCLMHTVDHVCERRVIQQRPGDNLNVLCVRTSLATQHTVFKWNDVISGFPV